MENSSISYQDEKKKEYIEKNYLRYYKKSYSEYFKIIIPPYTDGKIQKCLERHEIINNERKKKAEKKTESEFINLFNEFRKLRNQTLDKLNEFREFINKKKYQIYIKTYDEINSNIKLLYRNVNIFCTNTFDNSCISNLKKKLEQLKNQVEKDTGLIVIKQADILNLFYNLKEMVCLKNIYDCYYIYKKLDEKLNKLDEIGEVDKRFNFSHILTILKKDLQEVRNHILSNPQNAMLWAKLKHDEEIRMENQRHHDEIECLTQEEIDQLQKANEIAGDSLSEQSNQSILKIIDHIELKRIRRNLEE